MKTNQSILPLQIGSILSFIGQQPAASSQSQPRPAASSQQPAASNQRKPQASSQRPAASGQRPAASGQWLKGLQRGLRRQILPQRGFGGASDGFQGVSEGLQTANIAPKVLRKGLQMGFRGLQSQAGGAFPGLPWTSRRFPRTTLDYPGLRGAFP